LKWKRLLNRKGEGARRRAKKKDVKARIAATPDQKLKGKRRRGETHLTRDAIVRLDMGRVQARKERGKGEIVASKKEERSTIGREGRIV